MCRITLWALMNFIFSHEHQQQIEIENNQVDPNNHWMNPCSGYSFPQESPYQFLKQFVNPQ
jgi:hypothetical protein